MRNWKRVAAEFARRTVVAAVVVTVAALFGATALAQEVEQADPLGDVALDMHVVVGKLQKLSTDTPTQATQKEVVAKLDKLIEELEKQCQNCKGASSGANPTRPLADSRIIGGPGGIGKLHAARQDGRKWAELPAHERDRILQSQQEGFPPHYQAVLERYFRRLADEKPLSDADQALPKNRKPADSKPQASAAPVRSGGGAR